MNTQPRRATKSRSLWRLVTWGAHDGLGVLGGSGRAHGAGMERSECSCCHPWNLPVAKAAKSVHDSGQPMNHSTHVGFNWPGIGSVALMCWPSEVCWPGLSATRPGCLAVTSVMVGIKKCLFGCPLTACSRSPRPPRSPSDLRTVGHNPDAFAQVVGAEVSCGNDIPFRIEPERGQVSENNSKPPRSEHWAVLHEHVAGSNLANDPCHFSPQARAVSSESSTLAGGTDVLTREASRNHVNKAAPRSSVKTAHVRPNWEWSEGSIVLSLRQNLCGVGITFNCAHGSPSQEMASEDASTSACEKSQLTKSLRLIGMHSSTPHFRHRLDRRGGRGWCCASAEQRRLHSITDRGRQIVGPLAHSRRADSDGVGGRFHGAAQEGDGFGFLHGLHVSTLMAWVQAC